MGRHSKPTPAIGTWHPAATTTDAPTMRYHSPELDTARLCPEYPTIRRMQERSGFKMPSNLSIARRRKAFDEGRRSATHPAAENPYDQSKLRQLWELGRSQQQSGELESPAPAREVGEGEAQRAPRNPPRPKPPRRSSPPSSGPRRFGGRSDRSR